MLHVAVQFVVAIVLCGFATGTGISISIINGIVRCDGLSCPADTSTCRVSSDSSADLQTITVQRQCKSSTGVVLAQKDTNAPNLTGKTVHSVSESGTGGSGALAVTNDLQYKSKFGDAFDNPFFENADNPTGHHHHHRHHSDSHPPESFFGNAFNTPFFKNALNKDDDEDDDDDDDDDE